MLACLFDASAAELSRAPIVNAASHWDSVSPNSMAVIEGSGFRPGLRVELRYETGAAARLEVLRFAERRLEVWIPVRASADKAVLHVGDASAPVRLKMAAPGLYSANGLGWGRAAGNPVAAPGDSVSLESTGLRPGQKVTLLIANQVALGAAAPSSNRRTAVRFIVPAATPEGCAVPVAITSAGAVISNTVYVSVQKNKGPCKASGPLPVRSPGKNAVIIRAREPEPAISAVFSSGPSDEYFWPVPGTCTTLTSGVDTGLNALLRQYGGMQLDAGEVIAVNDGHSRMEIPGEIGHLGVYRGLLEIPGRVRRVNPDAETLYVTGEGGPGYPRFAAALKGPPAFHWINRSDVTTIRRDKPLGIEWKAATEVAWVVIVVESSNEISRGATYCFASPPAARFTIPKGMLSHLAGTTAQIYLVAGISERGSNAPTSGEMLLVRAAMQKATLRLE